MKLPDQKSEEINTLLLQYQSCTLLFWYCIVIILFSEVHLKLPDLNSEEINTLLLQYHSCTLLFWYCSVIILFSVVHLKLPDWKSKGINWSLFQYTQSGLIRNGGKFWLVQFLSFWRILYSFCCLIFKFYMVTVS